MTWHRLLHLIGITAILILCGCATRPINPPIEKVDLNEGYRYIDSKKSTLNMDSENLVILAFSGGGTRAAAFSFGALEALRDIELTGKKGNKARALDEVNIITGVSGGSFTALAYGLYGDKLFDTYESSFLKRDIQSEILTRTLNPTNWGNLASIGWGRSELAAELYDEVLFHGATYADLGKSGGPFVIATATDIASGTRIAFNQPFFDYFCSDLSSVSLSRVASASSAVPIALSPVTINNYGGKCQFTQQPWMEVFANDPNAPRPAARIIKQLQDMQPYQNSIHNPYIHLVDGGLADNLAMRGVLEALEGFEALYLIGQPTPLDHVRRIIVFIVNSLSTPKNNWNESEEGPGSLELFIKAAGVPIDHYSYEGVELLKDTQSRWNTMRKIRQSATITDDKRLLSENLARTPDVDLYAINVSFAQLKDQEEYEYLNNLPTSFSLPPEAVDRLRAAAKTIILSSPEFQRLLKDANARMASDDKLSGALK